MVISTQAEVLEQSQSNKMRMLIRATADNLQLLSDLNLAQTKQTKPEGDKNGREYNDR